MPFFIMINNSKTPIHPQIKNIIHNLDLDLGVELNRYEQSLRRDSALIAQSSIYDNSSFYSYPADQSVWYQSAVIEEEEEVIPVASLLIEEPTSLLDRLLTPWGIFGIIIFLGANLFIFFSWDNTNTVKNSANNNQTNLDRNTNSEQTNNLSSSTSENIPNNSSNSVITNIENSSPYPDLKTALFSEIEQPQPTINNINQLNQADSPVQPTQNTTNNDSVTTNTTLKNYYLLGNYTNMAEFSRIKNMVPSAKIVNIDEQTKIQLAVFDDENEAKTQSQQLKDKGIDNDIYSP